MKYVDNPVEPQKRVSEKKKHVSVSTETRFAFPSSDELTEARQESRVVLYQSAQIRDLGDTLAVLNLVLSKDVRIEE